MPLTWFAHQTPVVPLKMARPQWFDATALCIGSMMPDVLYAFSGYVHFDTHYLGPAMGWGIPLTLVIATLTRFVLAPVAALQIPDLGSFRLHSYAVLSRRRPNPIISLFSATIGIGSHLVLDAFTHPGRWGARWLGYDDISVRMFGRTEPLASVFQIIGHTLGSAVCVLFLLGIGRRRLLDDWYGADAVTEARAHTSTRAQRSTWWSAVAVGVLVGVIWGWGEHYMEVIQRFLLGAFAGGVVGALVVRRTGSETDATPKSTATV